jgi:DNA damage-binding protein 1
VLDTYDLPGNEIVESMTMTRFDAYPNQEYLFVGTVIESADDPDQSLGRILVFDLKENNKCELIEAIQLPGIIYNIKSFQNSVIACVNGSVSPHLLNFVLIYIH